MSVRFYNARVLTMTEGCAPFFGEVHTRDGKITFVGEEKDAPKEKFEREINLDGNLIMPSFKNAHTHSAMTFLRSRAFIFSRR